MIEQYVGYLKVKGDVKYTVCDISSPEAKELQKRIVDAIDNKYDWDLYIKLRDQLHKSFGVRSYSFKNMVVSAGRNVLARLLAGNTDYSGEINYCALGNTTATATAGNTTLGNELYRKEVSSKTYENNVAYVSTFFTATEIDGTFEEVGHFIDGSSSADTGQLWSRIATPDTAELPITKSNTESLTIDYKVVFVP